MPRVMRSALTFTVAFVVLLLASPMTAAACPPLLDLKLSTLTEDAVSLCRYEGKVLLVVNTASQCGYTPQYEGLEKLHRRYKDKGLVVIGFPSNDFGAQEPGSNKDIAQFCEVNYGVTFPMFAKSAVAKGTVNPFYERLAKASNSRPQWNFHKYLVDRKGREGAGLRKRGDAERSEVRQRDRAAARAEVGGLCLPYCEGKEVTEGNHWFPSVRVAPRPESKASGANTPAIRRKRCSSVARRRD